MVDDGTVNSSEVITQEAVAAQVNKYVEDNLVFRRAFHRVDATDVNSGSIEIPTFDSSGETVGTVAEGAAYPRTNDGQTGKVNVSFDKHGTEVEISYESIADSLFDVIQMHTEEKAYQLAQGLDKAAFDVFGSANADGDASGNWDNLNNNAGPVGNADGTLDYDDVVDAMTHLEGKNYQPDLLIVGSDGKGDLLKSPEFVRASEMGDDVVQHGAFGEILGIPVHVETAGRLADGEALMFDSRKYGVEAVREEMSSEEYDEPETNQRIIQLRTRRGYKMTRTFAGVRITG